MVEDGAGPSSLQGGPPAPSSDLPFNDTFQSPFAHSGGALGLTAVPLEISPSTVGPGPPPGSSALRLESIKSQLRYDILSSFDSPANIAQSFANYYRFDRDPQVLEKVAEGIANLKPSDPLSYVGRALIVHDKRDDVGQPSGNAGGRIGCTVISAKK